MQRTTQVRSPQARIPQGRTTQVRIPQVRTTQVRTTQVRTEQLRIPQVRIPQVRITQVRTLEVPFTPIRHPIRTPTGTLCLIHSTFGLRFTFNTRNLVSLLFILRRDVVDKLV